MPAGLLTASLPEVQEPGDRRRAQRTCLDRIGRTPIPTGAGKPNVAGMTPWAGSATALPAVGRAFAERAGKGAAALRGSKGVRPDHRVAGLQRALLLFACWAARGLGAPRREREAWGGTRAGRREDESLGLMAEVLVPFFALVPPGALV
ncbi:hypothetical protein [Deinococcus hopiensis]|uniref:hypothetical protein n=1 Tax=Deinococcus hopiensis TaxID=309885 RepID=UPI000A077EB5|nr:hypothetical protein [Deinococcus hopiensis]